MKTLFLISNGKCVPQIISNIEEELEGVSQILFIPFARKNYDESFSVAQNFFSKSKLRLNSIHHSQNYKEAILNARAFLVGGGNTFLLLKTLYDNDLLDLLKKKVNSGVPYLGYSAGANIATPNIKTTNDMPIVEPPSFDALNFVSFNINPHYFDPINGVPGETKIDRIREFHDMNDSIVLGIPEYNAFLIRNNTMKLLGSGSIKLFEKNKTPQDLNENFNFSKFLNI